MMYKVVKYVLILFNNVEIAGNTLMLDCKFQNLNRFIFFLDQVLFCL